MESRDIPEEAITSARCPGNLCAHISLPQFSIREEKKDVDSLLHDFCENCSLQVEEEPLCEFCRHLRLHHLAICLRRMLTGLEIELDLDRGKRGGGISRIVSNAGCALCSLLANAIYSFLAFFKKNEKDEEEGEDMRTNTVLSLSLRQVHDQPRLILHFFGLGIKKGEIEIVYRQSQKDLRPAITGGPSWPTFEEFASQFSIPLRAWDSDIGGQISWPTVQQWIHHCTSHHHCAKSESSIIPQGFRLIDINKQKLVSEFPSGFRLGRDIKFAALSYVWGKPDTSCTNNALLGSNKDELEAPGGLGKLTLPKAINDAITICEQLHQRFLWVDRLCIQQDDNGLEKKAQINAMGDIYSSAELTIIHASGASMEDPIAGVTTTRKVLQFKAVACGLEFISGYPDIAVQIQGSKWIKRGWTYQEASLSRRKLFFMPFELWFECSDNRAPYQREEQCSRHRLHESTLDQRGMTQYRINGFANGTTKFEDYVRHLESYTARSLTHQSDILDAFMGILTELYEGDLGIYGLPEADFDQGLLWYCKSKQTLVGTSNFPSWSWPSVTGAVTAPIIFMGDKGFLDTLVQWSYWDRNGELKIIKSKNSIYSKERIITSAKAHLLVAWWKGCIEPAVPEDVKQVLETCPPTCGPNDRNQLPLIERMCGHIENTESCNTCGSQISQRWPHLEDIWKDIHRARGTQCLTTNTQQEERQLIEKLRPGVLVTRAQTACLKVSCIERWGPSVRKEIYLVDSGGRRIGIVRPEYVDTGPEESLQKGLEENLEEFQKRMLRKFLEGILGVARPEEASKTASFECMGISLSDDQKLNSSGSTMLDSDLEIKRMRYLGRAVNGVREEVRREVRREEEVLLPEDQRGLRKPAVNVLVIHREEGAPFWRRIAVGWVYLADWIKADRTFKTIGLE